jgi:beta-glucosidase
MAVTPGPVVGVVAPPENLASPLNSDQQHQQQQAIMAAQDATDYNPQQQAGPESQLLDRDSYNGRIPQATYRTFDANLGTVSASAALSDDYDPPRPSTQVDADIQKMAESLTLKELVGQMTQIQIGMLLDGKGELDLGKVQYWVGEWGVGSFLDTPTK